MKQLVHSAFSPLVLGFSCLVFKKEQTEIGRSKGTEGVHQYKKEQKRVYSEKEGVTSIMIEL